MNGLQERDAALTKRNTELRFLRGLVKNMRIALVNAGIILYALYLENESGNTLHPGIKDEIVKSLNEMNRLLGRTIDDTEST